MKHSIFIAICLLALGFTSCNQSPEKEKDTRKQFRNEEGLLVKRTFYEEEGKEVNVLTEKTFKVENSDTILNGYAKSFYQNGQLMGEEHYKNGVKSGQSRQLYKDGQLNQVSWIKNGKLDSVGILYYPDGQVEAKTFWKNGKQVGEQLHYHKNGKLQIYSFYNPAGEAIYGRKYNEEGQLINEEGRQTPQLIYKGGDAEFTSGETLQVTIYAPMPPDSEVDLSVSIVDKDGQYVVNSQKVPIKNGKAVYKKELSGQGQYYFKTSLFFKDLRTGEKQTFENAFDYSVVRK